jgi:hypothetical protein
MSRPVVIAAIFLLATTAFVAFADEPPAPQPPAGAGMQLFLLIGQSNMAGRGKVEPQDLVAHPRVWKLTKEDQWAPAVDPLHFDRPNVVGVGLGKTFGETVADAAGNQDAHVGLIPCAVGGTSINKWNKGEKLYEEAVRRAKVAMKHGEIAGILWHQGESDSPTPEKRAGHAEKLERLIADLRADLNAPDVPFILGQLGEFHAAKVPGTADMNAILTEFPKTHPTTACVESKGLTDSGDKTHFDAKSLRELGRRYADAYLTLLKAK